LEYLNVLTRISELTVNVSSWLSLSNIQHPGHEKDENA